MQEWVSTAPKCYQYMISSESDPLGPAIGTKARMKGEEVSQSVFPSNLEIYEPGIGLTAPIESSLTMNALLSLALRQVPELDSGAEAVLDTIQAKSSEDYVAMARAQTLKTGVLHIPQTRLTKTVSELSITDTSLTSTKKLQFHFDKRVLQKEYFHFDFIPSFCFGTRLTDDVYEHGA